VAAGPYAIDIAQGSVTSLANYALTFNSTGMLTVNPAPIVVTANGGSSTYGSSPSSPGLSASGLRNGQAVGVLSGLSNSFGINASTAPVRFTLTVSGALNNPNYVVAGINPGSWVVAGQPLVELDWPSQVIMTAHSVTRLCSSGETPRLAESVDFPTMAATNLELDSLCVQ
jgi:hypothetical protein